MAVKLHETSTEISQFYWSLKNTLFVLRNNLDLVGLQTYRHNYFKVWSVQYVAIHSQMQQLCQDVVISFVNPVLTRHLLITRNVQYVRGYMESLKEANLMEQ